MKPIFNVTHMHVIIPNAGEYDVMLMWPLSILVSQVWATQLPSLQTSSYLTQSALEVQYFVHIGSGSSRDTVTSTDELL